MQKVKLTILYVLLIGGGIWHVLGYFDSLMKTLASPLIIGLGIWLFYRKLAKLIPPKIIFQKLGKIQLLLWSLFVIFSSIFIESVGVKTGIIFGVYHYGDNLPPYIGSSSPVHRICLAGNAFFINECYSKAGSEIMVSIRHCFYFRDCTTHDLVRLFYGTCSNKIRILDLGRMALYP